MLWKIFFCLLGLTLSCSGVPSKEKKDVKLSFSRPDLEDWITLARGDLFFSEEENDEFVKSTLEAADKWQINLGKERHNVTFEDALQYFNDEMGPLREEFWHLFFVSRLRPASNSVIPPNDKYSTAESLEFHTARGYLQSLFDKHAIYDFEKGILDLAKGMKAFAQASKILTEHGKSQFATKVEEFTKRHPSSKANLKERHYLTPSNAIIFLDERLLRKIASTSEPLKSQVRARITCDDTAFPGSKVFFQSKILPLVIKFRSLFNPRVIIPDDCEIFLKGSLEGFKDASDDAILSKFINQMVGIVEYCQSKGVKFDDARMKDWKDLFPQNFQPEPVKFKRSNLRIKVLIAFGIFALLVIAAVGVFIHYNRKKKQQI